MIYTLEAAARKCEVDTVNIMELVFFGHINIYKVESECSYGLNDDGRIKNFKKNVGISILEESLMHEIAEEYMDWYEINDPLSYQANASVNFREIRFLESEINAVMSGDKNIVELKETSLTIKPRERDSMWNGCVDDAILDFENDNGYKATASIEILQRLIYKTPKGYIVKQQGNKGFSIDDNPITLRKNLLKTINRRIDNQEISHTNV